MDFTTVVRQAVDQTDVLLAVIGSQWLTLTAENGGRRIDQPGDWVAEEIGTALRRATPVIPVLVDGARMPTHAELPPALADLANRQAMRIAHESFAADCTRVVESIEEMVKAAEPENVNLWGIRTTRGRAVPTCRGFGWQRSRVSSGCFDDTLDSGGSSNSWSRPA